MAKIVNFIDMFSYDVIPDVYEMDESQLRSYREDLEDRIKLRKQQMKDRK